jgi:hypothetical protein
MKLSELHRKYADALDLCERHDLEPTRAIKLDDKFLTYQSNLSSPQDCYTFPVAVVEGNPVFVGDDLYNPFGLRVKITNDMVDDIENVLMSVNYTWNPPKPKTFMLNGVELPAPIGAGYVMHIFNRNFCFKSLEDEAIVKKAILDLLDGKAQS